MLIAIKLIFFLAIIFFFGWKLSRIILREFELYILLPLSLALGLGFFIGIANLLAYWLGVKASIWASIFLLALIGLVWEWKKQPGSEIVLGIPGEYGLLVAGITVFIVTAVTIIAIRTDIFDAGWHFALASTIANGNFPVEDPFNIGKYVQYHYAVDFFMAAIHLVSNLPIHRTNDLVIILTHPLIFLSIFALTTWSTRSSLIGLFGALFFYFSAGFRYLGLWEKAVELVRTPGFEISISNLARVIFVEMRGTWGFFMGATHGGMVDATFVGFYYPGLIATPILLAIIYLFLKNLDDPLWLRSGVCGIMLGFLALGSEHTFCIYFFALGLLGLYHWWRKSEEKKPAFFNLFLIFFLAAILALFQGGVITDYLAHKVSTQHEFSTHVTVQSFQLRKNLGFPSWYNYIDLHHLRGWYELFKEMGIHLFLFPAAVIYFIWRRTYLASLAIMVTLPTIFIPLFLTYGSEDNPNILRFISFNFMTLLSGMFWASLIEKSEKKRPWLLTGVVLLLISVISPLGFYGMVGYQEKNRFRPAEHQEDMIAGDWVRKSLPRKSVIVGMFPQFSGAYSMFRDPRFTPEAYQKWEEFLRRGSLEFFQGNRVDYIWVDCGAGSEKMADSIDRSGCFEEIKTPVFPGKKKLFHWKCRSPLDRG